MYFIVLNWIFKIIAAEERQDQNAKRRKIEANGGGGGGVDGGMRMGETTYVPVETSGEPPIHPSLPQRPAFEVAPVNHASRLSMPAAHLATQSAPFQEGIKLASNHDVVANRRAIRMANMSAAEMLKAELAGRASVQTAPPSTDAADVNIVVPQVAATASDVPVEPPSARLPSLGASASYEDYASMDVLPGLGGPHTTATAEALFRAPLFAPPVEAPRVDAAARSDADGLIPSDLLDGEGSEVMDTDTSVNGENSQEFDGARGTKRKLEDVEAEDNSLIDEEGAPDAPDAPVARKVNPDGTVEQEDTIKCVLTLVMLLAPLT